MFMCTINAKMVLVITVPGVRVGGRSGGGEFKYAIFDTL
jgi:hypothetical protein